MGETQKEKISRLERDLAEARATVEEMRRKLYQVQEAADKEFEQSPCFRHLKQQNEALKNHIRILESRLSNAARKSDEQIEIIERLQKELQKSKKSGA